jgi:hypothetical protein
VAAQVPDQPEGQEILETVMEMITAVKMVTTMEMTKIKIKLKNIPLRLEVLLTMAMPPSN